jgi:hypothetical protein
MCALAAAGVGNVANSDDTKGSTDSLPAAKWRKEYSPRRKPWVLSGRQPSPEGAKEKVRHRLVEADEDQEILDWK